MKKNRKEVDESLMKYYTDIKKDNLDRKILFRLWMWIGTKLGWCRRYNVLRDYSMIDAYNSLNKAFEDIGGEDRWGKDLQMMN
jgi:hypothetical protein|tara:strand:+ start:4131 stop:4379 length:249 start_codon:yes stop_codon:yes gene_type:complete